jgi:hypothetical protein
VRARIITIMAGAEAEAAIFGHSQGGDGEDRYQIALMLEGLGLADPDKKERRLRAMTRMLVRRHRALIERAAEALLAKKTLTARQLDKLVGRSVHNIPINEANLPPVEIRNSLVQASTVRRGNADRQLSREPNSEGNSMSNDKTLDSRARAAVRKAGYGIRRSRVNSLYMIFDITTGGVVAGWPLGGDSREFSFTAEDVISWCSEAAAA